MVCINGWVSAIIPYMKPPEQGVREPQAALDRIRIIENGDPLVDMRGIAGLVFRDEPDKQVIPFLRGRVVKMLAEAAEMLPKPYHLYVVSALRDLEYQEGVWNRHAERYRKGHPEWPDHTVRRMANRYAAPVDHPAPPGHCTGAAVDVVLQKPDGSFVDLVPPDIEDWSLSHTWSMKVDAETRKARAVLLGTMLGVGFSNCRDEYWHYSWGDSGWAVRTGKQECYYGVVAVPQEADRGAWHKE